MVPSPLPTQAPAGRPAGLFDARARVSPAVEAEWARRVRAGDSHAFEVIFHTYYNPLCLFAERWLRSPELAEDVVCDVFCRLWEQRSAWEIHTSVAAYLYRAVRNRALLELRHERVVDRERELSISAAVSPGMGQRFSMPDEELMERQLTAAVEETLNELSARVREAFLLQRSHAMSYAEVAESMGISVSTVEKHMIRAIALLRSRLAAWY